MFLALDPGETTGYARFALNGDVIDFGQIKGFEKFHQFLENLDPKPSLIICEEWRLNPNVPQGGSTQVTVQIIGDIRSYALRHGIDIEWQPPRILKVGYGWAGIKPLDRALHSESHQYDALAHGTYYLVRAKIKSTALERHLKKQRGVHNDLREL